MKKNYRWPFSELITFSAALIPSSAELTGLGTAQLAFIGAGLATLDNLPPAPPSVIEILSVNPLTTADFEKFGDAVKRCRDWR